MQFYALVNCHIWYMLHCICAYIFKALITRVDNAERGEAAARLGASARIYGLQQASFCPNICLSLLSLLCQFPFVSRLHSDKIIFINLFPIQWRHKGLRCAPSTGQQPMIQTPNRNKSRSGQQVYIGLQIVYSIINDYYNNNNYYSVSGVMSAAV